MDADSQNRGVRWSRRQVIAGGLLPLLLAPALSSARLAPAASQPVRAPRRGGPQPTGNAQSAAHSPPERADRLTTPVFINGRGPYRFLVDTGAERSVLAEELAVQLALPRCPPVLLQGIILAQKTAEVRVERLMAGSAQCADLRVPVLPRAMLEADGYLGLDALDDRRVIFDFATHQVKVEKPEGFFSTLWTPDNQIRVRTQGRFGLLRSPDCQVDGVRATAFIDSGAEVSVCNPPLYAALRQRKSPPTSLATVQLSGVTGGVIVGTVTLIDTIRLPGMTLTVTPVVIADLSVFALWGLKHEPAILIGMNCLRAFSRVAIDFGRKDLLFQVPSALLGPTTLARADSQLG